MTIVDREAFLRAAFAEAVKAARGDFNPVIAAAQAALESNWGRSQLIRKANNLKGVKAGRSWRGPTIDLPTREQRPDGTWYVTTARWRKYRDWQHAFEDFGALMRRVYPHAVEVANDPRKFLEALVSGTLKYATDLNYVQKVWRIVEQFNMTTWGERVEDSGLILLYDAANKEVARTVVPVGATVLMRTTQNPWRVHIRPD